MRAGQFDRSIIIQAFSSTADDYGTPTEAWAPVATVRAQLVQTSTEEYLAAHGETDQTIMVFRLRYRSDVTTDHRIVFEAKPYNIRETKEIGRRKGLELRCEEVRT